MPLRNTTIYEALKRVIEDTLVLSLENVEFRPLISNYTRDTGFCSFGVYARKTFKKGDFISGLVGFKENEIIDTKIDVSVIRHHMGSKVILGGVSFVNSSCRENAAYVANTKQAQVKLRVTSSVLISPGDEITVLYSGDYFALKGSSVSAHTLKCTVFKVGPKQGEVEPLAKEEYEEKPFKNFANVIEILV